MNSSSQDICTFDVSIPEEFLNKLEHLSPLEKSRFDTLRLEWENWRVGTESLWKEKFRSREQKLRQQYEADSSSQLADRSDDLRRTHEDVAKLEAKLRTLVDTIEEKKLRFQVTEEQIAVRLAQKTAELQLLQRRVRDEAKMKIETENQRANILQRQLDEQGAAHERLQERARCVDREFDAFRQQMRSIPDTQLREELVMLKARYLDGLAQIEKERSLTSEAELEKEHYRSQMHRLALALKTERERSSVVARQELEQLRLEFLAREERYILDGDRAALGDIRKEVEELRKTNFQTEKSDAPISQSREEPAEIANPDLPQSSSKIFYTNKLGLKLARVNQQLSTVLASGMYNDENDPLVMELTKSLLSTLN